MAEDTEDNNYLKRSENEVLDDNKQEATVDNAHKNKVNNNIINDEEIESDNDNLDYLELDKGDIVRIKVCIHLKIYIKTIITYSIQRLI